MAENFELTEARKLKSNANSRKLQLTEYISGNASRLYSNEVPRFSSNSDIFSSVHNIIYPDPLLNQVN